MSRAIDSFEEAWYKFYFSIITKHREGRFFIGQIMPKGTEKRYFSCCFRVAQSGHPFWGNRHAKEQPSRDDCKRDPYTQWAKINLLFIKWSDLLQGVSFGMNKLLYLIRVPDNCAQCALEIQGKLKPFKITAYFFAFNLKTLYLLNYMNCLSLSGTLTIHEFCMIWFWN